MHNNLKKLTSMLLALLMLMSLIVVPVSAEEPAKKTYADTSAAAWYAEAVEYVTAKGIMNGVSEDNFAPKADVTRAMFVTILARLAHIEPDNSRTVFADVPAGKYYTGAVTWAYEAGIVNGVSEGAFAPNKSITRQDICTMVDRFVKAMDLRIVEAMPLTFADEDAISGYAAESVRWSNAAGVIEGFEDETFRPKNTATRAQIAVIVMRLDQMAGEQLDPMAEQHFVSHDGEIEVQVDAPKGALPRQTELTIRRVTDEAALAAYAEQAGGNVLTAVDITFTKDGVEIEPENPVNVQIAAPALRSAAQPKVVHFKNDGAAEPVQAETVSATRGGEAAVRFTAGDFSVYAIISDPVEYARLKIQFMNGSDNPAYYLKKSDIPENVEEIIHDPGVPVAEGKLFVGWSETQNDTADKGMTIAQVRDRAVELVNAGVTEGDTLTLYPMMKAVYYLYYSAEDGSVFQTEVVFHSEGSNVPAQITVNALYTTTQANQGFLGWVVKGTETPVYKNGSTMTITADTTLVPKIGAGHWLYFDEDDGGAGVGNASYTPPVFVPAGETTADYRPANPTRPGYTFDGWFTAATGGSLYPFTETLDSLGASDSRTVYAHWTAEQTAPYKVVIWAQNVNDDKLAADSAKTYDYVKSFELTAATDTQVTDALMASYMSYSDSFFGVTDLDHGSTAFQYSRWEVKNGSGTNKDCVSSTGDTVVNVYYDRKLFTIRFTGVSGGTTETYYDVVDTPSGTEVYGLIDGEYVRLDHQLVGKKLVALRKSNHNTVYADITGIYRNKDDKFITYDEIMNYSGNSNLEVGTIYHRINTGTTNYTLTTSTNSSYSTMYTKSSSGSKNDVDLRVDGVYDYTYQGATYPGPYFVKVSGNVRIFSGLYGQSFTKYNYEWFTPDSTHAWKNVAFLDSFNGNLFGASGVGSTPNLIMLTRDDSTFNTSIVFWTQSAGNLSTYVKAGTAGYSVGTDQGFNVTDRIQGMISEGYMWSTSEAMPSQWKSAKVMNSTTDGINDDGYTNVKRGNNTYLHIKYDRAVNDIIFLNGDDEVKTVADVPFGVSLAPYESEVPVISAETIQEGYYFAGWYEDPTFQKRADWSGTMPLSNKTLYARIAPVEYHVIVNLNGGSIDPTQSLSFWVPYNTVLDDTNFLAATPPDDHHSLIGYYTDAAFTKLWNFDTRLTNESMTLLYTGPDDPERVTYGDNGWDTTVGVFKLFARWRDDSIASLGGLTIQYYSGDQLVYTDPVKYGDLATVVVGAAPTSDFWPEDMKFDHWELNGVHYYPTETFMADSTLAEDTTVDGQDAKVLKLQAAYVDIEPKTDTHIFWYSNVQDNVGNPLDLNAVSHPEGAEREAEKGWVIKDENLQINVGRNIPDADTYSVNGYTFLGWARVDNADAGTTALGNQARGGEDLFLKWVPGEPGHYEALAEDGVSWVPVTQVAADEDQPYHDLYAVWQRNVFFVVHSSTGVMEAVAMPTGDSSNQAQPMVGTVDLTEFVTPGYLYGGYYKTYGGVDAGTIETLKTAYLAGSTGTWTAATSIVTTAEPQKAATVSGFTKYDGSSTKVNGTRFWDKNQAYAPVTAAAGEELTDAQVAANAAVVGTSMKPTANTVYYLKEVPANFLTSRTAAVSNEKWGGGEIIDAYLLTAVDDNYYTGIGFTHGVKGGTQSFGKTAALGKKFTLIQGDIQTVDVTPAKFGLTGGYIANLNAKSYVANHDTFTMEPTWTTLDGVTVYNDAVNYEFAENNTTLSWSRAFMGNETFYLSPGNDWLGANAIIRLYMWGNNADCWLTCERTGIDGVLKVEIPAGEWTGMIAMRCNPNMDVTNNGEVWYWDWYGGAGIWNKSGDISLTDYKPTEYNQNWIKTTGWSMYGQNDQTYPASIYWDILDSAPSN